MCIFILIFDNDLTKLKLNLTKLNFTKYDLCVLCEAGTAISRNMLQYNHVVSMCSKSEKETADRPVSVAAYFVQRWTTM